MILGQQLQQLTPSGLPCPECEAMAVIHTLTIEVTPQTVLTPQKAQGVGKGVRGYSLCISCLDRRELVPNFVTGQWEYREEEIGDTASQIKDNVIPFPYSQGDEDE